MYTLFIEGNLQPGTQTEFLSTIQKTIAPQVQKQEGFVDQVVCVDHGTQSVVSLSFWQDRQHAENYLRNQFQQQLNQVKQYVIEHSIKTRILDVSLAQKLGVTPSEQPAQMAGSRSNR